MRNFYDFICAMAFRLPHQSPWANTLVDTATSLLALLIAVIIYIVLKVVLNKVIKVRQQHRKLSFLALLFKRNVINLLINIFAAWVFFILMQVILKNDASSSYVEVLFSKLALLYIFLLILLFISFIIATINEFYEKKFDFSRQYPIYSYLKVIVVFVWFLGLTLICCYFTNTSPWAFLTGLGAISAVFMLLFRDTLLGIVASIQVTASNIVRIGDRITIDSAGIDGTVLDIAISTVKIKNADNTVASIPTYSLSSQVVKNWRAMEESGARRIKRSINIDIESIRELDTAFLAILAGKNEFSEFLAKYKDIKNNLTLYRNYISDYLTAAKEINKDYPILVHHLDAAQNGLQLEVAAYTTDVTAVGHERIKAELFEHFFIVLNAFDLKVRQD